MPVGRGRGGGWRFTIAGMVGWGAWGGGWAILVGKVEVGG